MSSKTTPQTKRRKAKTSSKTAPSPSKAAKLVTVTSLFKKQLERKEENSLTSPGVHVGDKDSDDGVEFIKEERSSPYFKQRKTETTQSNMKNTQDDVQECPENTAETCHKKLQISRRLSLRKTKREGQSLSRTWTTSNETTPDDATSESSVETNVIKCSSASLTVAAAGQAVVSAASGPVLSLVHGDGGMHSVTSGNMSFEISERHPFKRTGGEEISWKPSASTAMETSLEGMPSAEQSAESLQKLHITSKGKLSLKRKKSAQGSEPLHPNPPKKSLQVTTKTSQVDRLPASENLGPPERSLEVAATNTSVADNLRQRKLTDDRKQSASREPSKKSKYEGRDDLAENVEGDVESTEAVSEQYLVPYYLENFREVLKSVMEDDFYSHLFNETDLKYVAAFNSLTEESQKLYVRLFSRKLAWLPMSRIKYPEIAEDLTSCLDELVGAALLSSDINLKDLSIVLGALSAPDLRALAKTYHLNASGQQKGQIVQALVARTDPRRLFIRVMMLFSLANTSFDEESGNGGQAQLFQMLMVNIGRVVYPAYSINRQTRIFKNREDLVRFEEALQLESELLGRTGSGDWTGAYTVFLQVKDQYDAILADTDRMISDKTLPEFLRYYTAGSVLVRLLNQGIEILQRRKDYLAAVTLIRELLSQDVYNLDLHGFWWERLALNLDVHLKQHGQALQAIQDGLADSAVRTGHRLALYLRAESICNKSKSPYKKRLKEFNHEPLKELPKTFVEGRVLADAVAGRIHQFMTDSSQTDDDAGDVTLCNVEQVVLDHYNVSGYPQGVHAEGSILSTLFILYFWDVLFMDVADVFHSPYQTHPLDFNTDAFYQHRKECIDARLAEIEKSSEEELQKMMAETWETHYSVLCAGVNWERFASIDQIKGLISCVGGRVLAGILGRYAVQPRHTRGGFPDLTLWNTDTKQLKICEVKGPGDRLSHKQMLWLDHLLKLGVDAEVCHVKGKFSVLSFLLSN
ncbi:hypothetical protein BaRGS_00036091 [Batillaria attramentaria]|uniref:Fanconi-associated nuclease n=1 Tax=Batillaria attramentaria TaxID=370345 RepID=A0ABD0JCT5_9CAEN